METMKDIKARFASAKEGEYNALFRHYENDERSGVQKLIQQYHKKLQAMMVDFFAATSSLRNLTSFLSTSSASSRHPASAAIRIGATGIDFSSNSMFGIIFLLSVCH